MVKDKIESKKDLKEGAIKNKLNVRDAAKSKNNYYIGIKGESDTVIYKGNKKSKSQGIQVAAKPKELEEKSHPALIRNSMIHPVELSYEGKMIRLSPRERVKIANYNKLGALPRGVYLIKS